MTAAPLLSKTLPGPARLARSGYDGARSAADKTNGRAALAAPAAILQAGSAAPSAIPPSYSIRINRPLISLWTAAGILDCNEDAIERDTESGKLEWAFNLARDPDSRRRCVRVFTREVLDRKAGVKHDYSLAFVLNACFPASRASFRLREVAFAWHVSELHVTGLFRQGLLKPVDPSARPAPLYGHGKFPRLSRTSLADFLQKRRII
jgi:hypothetical protein